MRDEDGALLSELCSLNSGNCIRDHNAHQLGDGLVGHVEREQGRHRFCDFMAKRSYPIKALAGGTSAGGYDDAIERLIVDKPLVS